MKQLFAINGIVFSIEAENGIPAAEILCRKLAPLAVEQGNADIRFILTPELPRIVEPFTKLEKFRIGQTTMYGVAHSLLNYLISREDDGTLNVQMCPVRKNMLREAGSRINKGWKYLIRYGCSIDTCVAKRYLISLMLPVLFFKMAERGMTFVHCSAVAKDGRSFLFPAWGGVGKTSLMSHFLAHGWKYICDDLTVMDRRGHIHHFPIPMHIYRYHRNVCPAMTDRMESAMTGEERFLWNFAAHFVGESKLVRWIEPVRVFGEENIVREAPLDIVVHMQRSSASGEIRVEPSTPNRLAGYICNTILNEIGDIALMTSLPNAINALDFIPDLSTILNDVKSIAIDAMKNAELYEMQLPANATPEETYRFLAKKWEF